MTLLQFKIAIVFIALLHENHLIFYLVSLLGMCNILVTCNIAELGDFMERWSRENKGLI